MLTDEVTLYLWEKTSRDSIDFKRVYAYITQEVVSGLMLSQIVYWFLPSKKDGKLRARIKRDGKIWVAIKRDEWWGQCCVRPKQADRCLSHLEDLGLIEIENFKFGKAPVNHIHLRIPALLKALNAVFAKQILAAVEDPDEDMPEEIKAAILKEAEAAAAELRGLEKAAQAAQHQGPPQSEGLKAASDMDFTQRVNSILPDGLNQGYSPTGDFDFTQTVKSYTKTSAETSETSHEEGRVAFDGSPAEDPINRHREGNLWLYQLLERCFLRPPNYMETGDLNILAERYEAKLIEDAFLLGMMKNMPGGFGVKWVKGVLKNWKASGTKGLTEQQRQQIHSSMPHLIKAGQNLKHVQQLEETAAFHPGWVTMKQLQMEKLYRLTLELIRSGRAGTPKKCLLKLFDHDLIGFLRAYYPQHILLRHPLYYTAALVNDPTTVTLTQACYNLDAVDPGPQGRIREILDVSGYDALTLVYDHKKNPKRRRTV